MKKHLPPIVMPIRYWMVIVILIVIGTQTACVRRSLTVLEKCAGSSIRHVRFAYYRPNIYSIKYTSLLFCEWRMASFFLHFSCSRTLSFSLSQDVWRSVFRQKISKHELNESQRKNKHQTIVGCVYCDFAVDLQTHRFPIITNRLT